MSTWVRDTGSAIGLSMSMVGTLWSSVAIVRSGASYGAPGQPEALEGLRTGDLVHEMEVNVDEVGIAVSGRIHVAGHDNMVAPDLLGESKRLGWAVAHGSTQILLGFGGRCTLSSRAERASHYLDS